MTNVVDLDEWRARAQRIVDDCDWSPARDAVEEALELIERLRVPNNAEPVMNAGGRFMQASDHHYNCRCSICLDWWVSVGPDGGERNQFGPFEPDEIEARANALGVRFNNGEPT